VHDLCRRRAAASRSRCVDLRASSCTPSSVKYFLKPSIVIACPRDSIRRAHINRDLRFGSIAAPMTASTEPPSPSASSATRPNTSTTVILSISRAVCAPACPGLVTSTALFRDTSAGSPTDSSSLSRRGTRDHVGCHASRSMRATICRNRRRVKWLSASCRVKYRACRTSSPASAGYRSDLPSAYRRIVTMFRPST